MLIEWDLKRKWR